jgi:signal transduction histidine kinase
MKKNTGILIITTAVLCVPFVGRADRLQIIADSLIHVLATQKNLPTEEQLTLYRKIGTIYRYTDLEKTKRYCREGITLANKTGDLISVMKFYSYLGEAHEAQEHLDSALLFHQKALDAAIESEDQYMIANCYNTLAGRYNRLYNYSAGMDCYFKALDISEKMGNKEMYAMALCNIGGMYRGLDKSDKALDYFMKSDSVAAEIHESRIQKTVCSEIGIIYYEKEDYDKALQYQQKALEISRANNQSTNSDIVNSMHRAEIRSLHGIAGIYVASGDYDQALKYAQESLYYLEKYDDVQSQREAVNVWNHLAEVYFYRQEYPACEQAALKAWTIDSTDITVSYSIASTLAKVYIYLDKKEKAIYYFERLNEILQEKAEDHFNTALAEHEVKYEAEKKEMQIAALEKEKTYFTRLAAAGFVIVLLALVAGILYFIFRKQKDKLMEKERILLASEAVQSGENEERKRIARDLHDGLGGMLSSVQINLDSIERLENARELLSKSMEELRRISHNLMPASLQYGIKPALEEFCRSLPNVHFHCFGLDEPLSEKINLLLYRCAHELVNNALKYADAGVINVQLAQTADNVTLTVSDNGCGFDITKQTQGMGLQYIRDRIAVVGGKIEINSSKSKGTETSIELQITNA